MATAVFGDLGIEIMTGPKILIKTRLYSEPIAIPEDLHSNNSIINVLKPPFKEVMDNLDRLGKAGIVVVPDPSLLKNIDSTDILDVLAGNFAGGIRTYDTIMQDIKENGLGGIRGGVEAATVFVILMVIGAVVFAVGATIAAAGGCFAIPKRDWYTRPVCHTAGILITLGAILFSVGALLVALDGWSSTFIFRGRGGSTTTLPRA
jgi:hypothetical protein